MSERSQTETPSPAPDRAVIAAVVAALLFFVAATWIPGPSAWGLNHFAYLPVGVLSALVLVFGVAFIPWTRDRVARALQGPVARGLFESKLFYFFWAPLFVLTFVLLGRSNHFLGDGAWLAYAVQEGEPFHFFDFNHYHVHYRLYRWLGESVSGIDIYRWSSVVAGGAALFIWRALLCRLGWERWRRSLAFILLFTGPPALLFYGYLESYAFSFVFLTAFLLAGLAALEGRLPAWVAGAFFGLAWFFHLGVVFSAPALLVLAWSVPKPNRLLARILAVCLPALVGLLAGVLAYLVSGYDGDWFRREFLDSSQGGEILISLRGDRGFFSALHWKDLLNTAALTGLVPLAVVLARLPVLKRRLGDPRVRFLLVHLLFMALVRMVVDAKLGGAKDWDLLVMHSASLPLLAVHLLAGGMDANRSEGGSTKIPTPRAAVFAVLASVAVFVPWVSLQSRVDDSIHRLIEVTRDAPAETRTFVLEHVARIYRERGDFERAMPLYKESVRRAPTHVRLRFNYALLLLEIDRFDEADRELDRILTQDPGHLPALEVAAARAAGSRQWEVAFAHYSKLCGAASDRAQNWQSFARVAFHLSRWEAAAEAFERGFGPSLQSLPLEAGMTFVRLGRHEDAAEVFRGRLDEGAQGEMDPVLRVALAGSLLEAAEVRLAGDREVARRQIEEADQLLQGLSQTHPDDRAAPALRDRVVELRSRIGS